MPRRNGYGKRKGGAGKTKDKNPKKKGKQAFTAKEERQIGAIALRKIAPTLEYKYATRGVFNIDGNVAQAAGFFASDVNGMMRDITPQIQVGSAHEGNRIGNSVRLKRLYVQLVTRWANNTPLWNTKQGAYTNAVTATGVRGSCRVNIKLFRVEYGDGSMANLANYIEGNKRMYKFGESQNNLHKDTIKQECKLLAQTSFKITRKITAVGLNNYDTRPIPVETMLKWTGDQELVFKKPSELPASNSPVNYKYFLCVKYGHMEDLFANIDVTYNPRVRIKAHYWYTDA